MVIFLNIAKFMHFLQPWTKIQLVKCKWNCIVSVVVGKNKRWKQRWARSDPTHGIRTQDFCRKTLVDYAFIYGEHSTSLSRILR